MGVKNIGLLNPGAMGATIGAAAGGGGATVSWVSAGRSAASARRAADAGLTDAGSIVALLADSEVVLSVCPPHAAVDLAREVAGHGFDGIYVDCNAVAPATALAVGEVVRAGGARFVDGGIIGPPAHRAGTTRLYLSGEEAASVAANFEGSPVDAVVVDGRPGSASAVKMAYAAWTKGSSALLLGVRALAAREGVEDALLKEWSLSQAGLEARSESTAAKDGLKAWRFAGEMREIASTFAAGGLPSGFHEAAAEIFDRLAGFKDDAEGPPIEAVVAALLAGDDETRKAG